MDPKISSVLSTRTRANQGGFRPCCLPRAPVGPVAWSALRSHTLSDAQNWLISESSLKLSSRKTNVARDYNRYASPSNYSAGPLLSRLSRCHIGASSKLGGRGRFPKTSRREEKSPDALFDVDVDCEKKIQELKTAVSRDGGGGFARIRSDNLSRFRSSLALSLSIFLSRSRESSGQIQGHFCEKWPKTKL